MKLTEAQHVHLMNLVICTDYQCKETPALVKLGLATIGKSRYCAWARITPKGRELVMSLPMPERIRLEGEVINSKMPAHSATAARYSAESCPVTAKQRNKRPVAYNTGSTSSTRPNGAAVSGATISKASSRPLAQVREAGSVDDSPSPSRRMTATALGLAVTPQRAPAACPLPNAVRIIVGQRATYYPVSMLKSISHVSKQVVCTTNPFYKPLPLATSERNDIVL